MSDLKYGRLFTERDVALVVAVAFMVGYRDGVAFEKGDRATTVPKGRDPLRDHVLQRVERDHALTFPADEPLFLLRAQDEAALDTLYEYGANVAGGPDEHREGVRAAIVRFQQFLDEHPDRVKAPD